MKNKKAEFKNLLLLIFSFIFSIYLIELLLSLNKFIEQKHLLSHSNNDLFQKEKRNNFEVYYDLKKNNIKSIFKISFNESFRDRFYLKSNKSLIPLSGRSYFETIHCNESDFWAIYRSDRYGFNNPDYEWDKKESILLVGDSYVHGACVLEKDTISGQLRFLLNNNFPIINLGTDGKGPLSQFATIKEYSSLTRPKVILWFYYEGNDLLDLQTELKNKILSKYFFLEDFDQALKDKQTEIDLVLDEMFLDATEGLSRSRFFRFLKLRFVMEFIKKTENIISNSQNNKILNTTLKDLEKVLEKTKKYSENNNIKLVFVYLPQPHRFLDSYNENYGYNYYLDINSIIKKLDIPMIDIYKEVFLKYEDPKKLFPFERINHYNAFAYKLIAKKIYESLDQN
jgi:hypothetical protein